MTHIVVKIDDSNCLVVDRSECKTSASFDTNMSKQVIVNWISGV